MVATNPSPRFNNENNLAGTSVHLLYSVLREYLYY